jgi:hypothetical protein
MEARRRYAINPNILSADVAPRKAATVRATAKANGVSVSELLRIALKAWLR